MSCRGRSLSLAGAVLLGAAYCSAQSTPEYQAKVVLLEKLTRFVDWPARATTAPSFVLGVVGRTPFGDDLDAHFAARTLKNRPVTVRYFRDASDLGDCDLLFICASEKPRLASILARVRGKAVLTLADTDGFAQAGVMVGLVRVEAKVSFQVNLTPVRDSGFRIAPGFLQLATLVP
jgi:hypothetical protein